MTILKPHACLRDDDGIVHGVMMVTDDPQEDTYAGITFCGRRVVTDHEGTLRRDVNCLACIGAQ